LTILCFGDIINITFAIQDRMKIREDSSIKVIDIIMKLNIRYV